MKKDELLKMLLDDLAESGNLDFEWTTKPDDENEAWILTSEEGIFILTIQDAKIEVVK